MVCLDQLFIVDLYGPFLTKSKLFLAYGYFLEKIAIFSQKQITNLYIPSEKLHQDLLNTYFNFEIGHSKLELQP